MSAKYVCAYYAYVYIRMYMFIRMQCTYTRKCIAACAYIICMLINIYIYTLL